MTITKLNPIKRLKKKKKSSNTNNVSTTKDSLTMKETESVTVTTQTPGAPPQNYKPKSSTEIEAVETTETTKEVVEVKRSSGMPCPCSCCPGDLTETVTSAEDPQGSLLGWTPEATDIRTVPTPLIHTLVPKAARIPTIHIRPTPPHLNIATPVIKKPITFRIDSGLIQCVETKEHVGGFLMPPDKCQTLFDEIEVWVNSRQIHESHGLGENCILRVTNVMTWYKTRLYRLFALIGRGNKSAAEVKNELHKIHKHFPTAATYAVFDVLSMTDREVSIMFRTPIEHRTKKESNIFFKWIGDEGLAALFKEDVDFDKQIAVSQQHPLFVHNGLKISGDEYGSGVKRTGTTQDGSTFSIPSTFENVVPVYE